MNLYSTLSGPFGIGVVLLVGTDQAFSEQSGWDQFDLTLVSLEELMDIKVTPPGKNVQKLTEVSSAPYVITQEYIPRSAVANLSGAMLPGPGIDAARLDSGTNEDILALDLATETRSLVFDSVLGLGGVDINVFDVMTGSLLSSVTIMVSDVEAIEPTDIVRFTPTIPRDCTTETDSNSRYFEGSDVELALRRNVKYAPGALEVCGAAGRGRDVSVCVPGTVGTDTTCNFSIFFGDQWVDRR